jgi:hypothetical protein
MDGSWLEWTLGVMFFTVYIFCIFTVCMITFKKGHMILGILGIFMPILWLIGAVLPARRGSSFDVAQQQYYRQAATAAPVTAATVPPVSPPPAAPPPAQAG